MPIVFGRRGGSARGTRSRFGGRMVIAAVIALIAIMGYFANSVINPVTGKKQYLHPSLDEVEEEIALGLQAAPEMAAQFGGLSPDAEAQRLAKGVGARLVRAISGEGTEYPFEFHVLADAQTVNAFALPGGQVFITEALFRRLETEGQLAGVLGHEIGHVLARHAAARMAKAQLAQGLTGAAVVGASDPENPQSVYTTAAMAQLVAQFVTMKYGREDELESDHLAVRFMPAAGYDPRSLVRVMEILGEASGGGGGPEFASTHPSPQNRIQRINAAIEEQFPRGLPDGLTP